MKIALVFWGLTRSLSKTYKNIKKNILDNLKKQGIEYKIFMHTYYFFGEHTDHRTGEINIKLNFEEYKLLNPDYIKIDNQDKIKKQIKINQYKKYKYSYSEKTIENLICALYSQKEATELLERSKYECDYVWYLRPDVIYKNSLPLRWLKWVESDRILVPKFASFGGINDRMGIMKLEASLLYGKRFNLIMRYGDIIGEKKISSERFIAWVMSSYRIKKIDYVFKRLRANGEINNLDRKLF